MFSVCFILLLLARLDFFHPHSGTEQANSRVRDKRQASLHEILHLGRESILGTVLKSIIDIDVFVIMCPWFCHAMT